MSATEWKFVPIEPTVEMVAALGFDGDVDVAIGHGAISAGIVSAYTAMLEAAPVPPSVESLLENWTPSDQKAFAKFRDEHFPGEMSSHAIQSLGSAWKDGQANAAPSAKNICRNDGRCEYAIQIGAEGNGHCPDGNCAMPASAPGTGSDTLDCILGVGGFGSFGPLDSQPAHLTIPGALEWDGDNGTHGADGESRVHGESSQPVAYIDLHSKTMFPCNESVEKYLLPGRVATPLYAHADSAEVSRLRARLADRDAVLNQAYMALIGYLPSHRNDLTDAAIAACSALLFPVEAKAACSRCGGWGHIETKDSAHDCPECGPSVIERTVEAGVMNAPGKCYEPHGGPKCGDPDCQNDDDSFSVPDCPDCACVQDGDCLCAPSKPSATPSKTKICIECDQPYCHGVCVERGDQDYDRDQAAKGGCDD